MSRKSVAGSSDWLRRAGLIALGAAGSFTLLIGVASLPLSGLLIRPRLKRLSQLKSQHLRRLIKSIGIDFEDVVITSFDGTRLQGWWMEVSREAPTIVVVHGVKKNRTDVIRTALVLRRAGFNILVFDARAHGNSGGHYVTYGYYERRDVEKIIEWVVRDRGVDPARVGLAGESMGAAIALQVAASNPQIAAVWADSPFASLSRVASEFVCRVTHLPGAVVSPVVWSALRMANLRGRFDVRLVNPLSMASKVKCPVFIVHGTADQLILTSHSESIFDALGGEKEMWLVEGAGHARAVQFAKCEYSELITRFFAEHLRQAEPPGSSRGMQADF